MLSDIKVIKRNGQSADFEKQKIINAILSANKDVLAEDRVSEEIAKNIEKKIEEKCSYRNSNINVEEIQDMVENALMERGYYNLAREYIKYRYKQAMARDRYAELMKIVNEKLTARNVKNQNANVDEKSFGGRIGEMSGAVMKKVALETMSEKSRNNHLNNEVYIHDLDAYMLGDHNCLSIPFDRLLAEGFNTRQTDVRPASSINTAMQLVAVIFQLQSLMQFGGVAATHIDWTLVPYVQKSFYKHFIDGLEFCEDVDPNSTVIVTKYGIKKQLPLDSEDCQTFPKAYKYAMRQTKKELDQAVEGMYHNLNTLQSRSGNQLPFSSLNYGTCTSTEGRMVIRALLEGSIKGVGKNHKTPIFPCGIFQMKTGINRYPGDPNYDLFKLAVKSTSQRLYPNYANCDWSNQINWEKADMVGRQKVIDELASEKYELLKTKLQENENEQDFFGLSIKDGKIVAEIIQKPETLFSTMRLPNSKWLKCAIF